MDSNDTRDAELAARLKRLDAGAVPGVPGFDYAGLLERHARGIVRARRRLVVARGAAVALAIALLGASVWRLDQHGVDPGERVEVAGPVRAPAPQPRIVRADTYLAVAALEDHIANLDDALNYARLRGGTADVARLERTRAELIHSYTQVRYAEMVSASF
ncbi:MAG TPA: hypothetical protein VFO82_13960 [Steroidobacteraceae bacterium]|nr:hypothetical protein [Steroidobacteraceae bacterium]